MAPCKVAVLPVVKSDAGIMNMADALFQDLLQTVPAQFDATQSIGKRYRRQDEIGTPLC
ncbi:glycine--tRNA ligase, partial [archaeon]